MLQAALKLRLLSLMSALYMCLRRLKITGSGLIKPNLSCYSRNTQGDLASDKLSLINMSESVLSHSIHSFHLSTRSRFTELIELVLMGVAMPELEPHKALHVALWQL